MQAVRICRVLDREKFFYLHLLTESGDKSGVNNINFIHFFLDEVVHHFFGYVDGILGLRFI